MSKANDIAFTYAKENGTIGYDYNQIYDAVKYGYELAENDTIERTITWLRKNWREYVWQDNDNVIHFGLWENDLHKAIQNEEECYYSSETGHYTVNPEDINKRYK